jgi:hypothetical protein
MNRRGLESRVRRSPDDRLNVSLDMFMYLLLLWESTVDMFEDYRYKKGRFAFLNSFDKK